jgi:hypothetical protein
MADFDYVGPFELWDVVVNGHVVPFLTATPLKFGGVHLCLDRRIGIDLSGPEAVTVVPFLADCIAVVGGRTCHPCEEVPEPPLRRAAVRIYSLADSPAGAELD